MEFVRYANSALTNQGHGGLVSSLSENMFKAVLVEKINNFLESEDYVSRVGTTAIGKTNSNLVDENVLVLSEEPTDMSFFFIPLVN